MNEICAPHFRRTGKKVKATRMVAEEPMCEFCFRGRPVAAEEEMERFDLPWFLKAITAKPAQAGEQRKALPKAKSA